jgi:hypothetical protein
MPETVELTVRTAPANIHKSPTVASAVVGQAARGTVIEIRRNLGSWVEVLWPAGENGLAFVHVNAGTIARRPLPVSSVAAATPTSSTSAPAAQNNKAWLAEQIGAASPSASPRPSQIVLPNHSVGIGGRMSSSVSDLGAAARAWWGNRLGLQFELSQSRFPGINGQEHARSLQFAPSVLYSLPDGATTSFWVRPYLGAGSVFYRATLAGGTSGTDATVASKGMAFRAFGGAETTFAGAPQFALSIDVGHSWRQTSFAGSEPDSIGVSLSGHWYVK